MSGYYQRWDYSKRCWFVCTFVKVKRKKLFFGFIYEDQDQHSHFLRPSMSMMSERAYEVLGLKNRKKGSLTDLELVTSNLFDELLETIKPSSSSSATSTSQLTIAEHSMLLIFFCKNPPKTSEEVTVAWCRGWLWFLVYKKYHLSKMNHEQRCRQNHGPY